MLQLWQNGRHVIGRVSVRCRDADRAAAELRLPALLRSVEWQPAGISSAAILCVRRLSDPCPGSLSVAHDQLRPPAAWRDALQASLDRLARHAARPWRGMAGVDCEAVLFADYAEMLACLGRDWCEGFSGGHWWWKRLAPVTEMPRGLIETWLGAAEYIPAALELMAERKIAIPFVRRLTPRHAQVLLAAVLERHALPGIREALAQGQSRARPDHIVEAVFAPAHTTRPDAAAPIARLVQRRRSPEAPWQPWAPDEASASLELEQHSLLGISLTVRRQPQIARSSTFALAVAAWARSVEVALEQPDAAPSSPNATAFRARSGEENESPRPSARPEPLPAATPATVTPAKEKLTQARSWDEHRAPKQPLESDDVELLTVEQALPTPDVEAAAATFESETEPCDRIDTEFGGVFYLINLAIYMGVYGDFTTPSETGLSLALWDFLALLGVEFIGPDIMRDSIWPFLARLSGRDPCEAPGANWTPPDGSSKDQWIAAFASRARDRLRLALGMAEEDDPGPMLCRHAARVFASGTHIDIHLSLQLLPISIRFAGLDRNPGWVPAGGRFVAFHFE